MAGRGIAPLLAVLAVLQGCAHHPLKVRAANGYGDHHKVNTNAFFWGAIDETEYADKCETHLIHEVQTVTSVPQALATILTLGIWMPSTVKYKCAKRPVLPDDPEETRPAEAS